MLILKFWLIKISRKLARPRRILLLVRAGDAVDAMIGLIAKYLEKGDIIIDGGNSSYTDTEVCFFIYSFLFYLA